MKKYIVILMKVFFIKSMSLILFFVKVKNLLLKLGLIRFQVFLINLNILIKFLLNILKSYTF